MHPRTRDHAAAAIEYAIVVVGIAVAVVFVVYLLGQQVSSDFECTRDVVYDPLYACPD